MKPELGDFTSSRCPVVEYFNRSVFFEKTAQQSHVWNFAKAKCLVCSQEVKIPNISDMYEHLFINHKKLFIKVMILTDLLVDHVMEHDITFIKEEVKAVAVISNCMGFGCEVLSICVKEMIKKKQEIL